MRLEHFMLAFVSTLSANRNRKKTKFTAGTRPIPSPADTNTLRQLYNCDFLFVFRIFREPYKFGNLSHFAESLIDELTVFARPHQ